MVSQSPNKISTPTPLGCPKPTDPHSMYHEIQLVWSRRFGITRSIGAKRLILLGDCDSWYDERMQWLKPFGRWMVAWGPLMGAYLLIGFICINRVDPDFGWHYMTGQYIWAHGVPMHDIFTYTARDFRWVNHEWAYSAFVYLVASTWSYRWLGLMFAGLWVGALWLAAGRKPSWITMGLAVGAVIQYVGIRGITASALGLAVVLWLLRRRRHYWLLVPLVAVWANLHGGFVIGLGMAGLAALWRRERRLFGWVALGGMAALANPYGWRVYEEIWRTMSDGGLAGRIVEWAPLDPTPATAPYVVLITVLVVTLKGWGFDRVRAIGLVVAALWSNRHMPMLVVGTIGLFEQTAGQIGRLLVFKFGRRGRWAMIAGAVILGGLYPISLLWWRWPLTTSPHTLDRPTQALAALRDEPCRGQVFNDYTYGGLMIMSLPGVPVYIDGRMPSWKGPEGSYLDRYVEVLKGGDVMREDFTKYGINCVLLSDFDVKLHEALANDPTWHQTVKAQDAELWRRD